MCRKLVGNMVEIVKCTAMGVAAETMSRSHTASRADRSWDSGGKPDRIGRRTVAVDRKGTPGVGWESRRT